MTVIARKVRLITAKLKFPQLFVSYSYGSNSWKEWLSSVFYLFMPWILRPSIVTKYERELEKYSRIKHVRATGSGRTALYTIINALSLDQGAEVILPAYTCVVVPNAILYAGFKLKYIDIDPNKYRPSFEAYENALTLKTKVLYLQTTFGIPLNLEPYLRLASEKNLWIIVDSAHGPIPKIPKSIENEDYKKVVFFISTDRTKFINTVCGGAIFTESDDVARACDVQLDSALQPSQLNVLKMKISFIYEFIFTSPYLFWMGDLAITLFAGLGLRYQITDELSLTLPKNYPIKMSKFQAALGLAQMSQIEKNIQARASWSTFWSKKFGTETIPQSEALLRYPYTKTDRHKCKAVLKYIEPSIWFNSTFQGRYESFEQVHYQIGTAPNAEKMSETILNLPTHGRIPKLLKLFI